MTNLNITSETIAGVRLAVNAKYKADKFEGERKTGMRKGLAVLMEAGVKHPLDLLSPNTKDSKSNLAPEQWAEIKSLVAGVMDEEDQRLLSYSTIEAPQELGKKEMRFRREAMHFQSGIITEFRKMLIAKLSPKKKGAQNAKKDISSYLLDSIDAMVKRLKNTKEAPFDNVEAQELLASLRVFVLA